MTQPLLRELIYRPKQQSKMTTLWLFPCLWDNQRKTMREIKVKFQLKQVIRVWLCNNVGYICLMVSGLSYSAI